MATSAGPKSILKKYPATTGTTREDRNREVALYHAHLIQQRKDIELSILLNLETLIDYPLATAPYDASNPSPVDAQNFLDLIQQFRPSDYDDLIVERNINEHCGYSLCPKARVTDGAGGKYRLVGKYGKAKDFNIVEKGEVEKWCSEACAKRALYIRVQLSDTPAWERETSNGTNIELYKEPLKEQQITGGLAKVDLGESAALERKQDATDLALERGDKGLAAKQGLVDVVIKEKIIENAPRAPSLVDNDLSDRLDTLHLNLEGHTTKFGSERQRRQNDEDEEEDTDWKF
jgi:hypothetical protein